jgi:hypothetical protein
MDNRQISHHKNYERKCIIRGGTMSLVGVDKHRPLRMSLHENAVKLRQTRENG